MSEITVCEHAVIRYLERAMFVDIEEIKAKILTKDLECQILALGNGKYPIGNGLKAVVKNNTIITVVPV